MNEYDRSRPASRSVPDAEEAAASVGKRTLTQELVRRVAAGGDVAADAGQHVAAAAGSAGRPLSRPLREKFERSLGADLGAVRLHTGPESEQAAEWPQAGAAGETGRR